MTVEHDFFGLVEETAKGWLAWSDTVELDDQSVEVEMGADGAAVSAEALDAAAALIQALDGFDSRARDALIAELSSRQSATSAHIDGLVERWGDSLLDLLVLNSGDIAFDVLRSLQLLRVTIWLDHGGDDEVFARFDYSISPDETDALLAVSFDARADVVAVETQG